MYVWQNSISYRCGERVKGETIFKVIQSEVMPLFKWTDENGPSIHKEPFLPPYFFKKGALPLI